MKGWNELSDAERVDAARRYKAGVSYDALHTHFHISPKCQDTFDRRLREGAYWLERLAQDTLKAEDVAEAIKNRPQTVRDLSHAFDKSEASIRQALEELKAQAFNIVETPSGITLDTQTPPRYIETALDAPSMTVCLAIESDLHAGSKAQQITALRAFEQQAVEYGAQAFLIPGDLFAGLNVYRGQWHDNFLGEADEQVRFLDRLLPNWNIPRLVLGGNHDFSFIKAAGFDAVKAFCKRSDCTYLGYDSADIHLTDRVDVRLHHGSGAGAYALSYRLQKGMESSAFEEMQRAIDENRSPNLRALIAGHLHTACVVQRGPVLGMQAGCFEGQTNYLKAKGLYPQIGGYLLWLTLTDSGVVVKERTEFLPFKEIRDDYLAYREMDAEADADDTLFTWQAGASGSAEITPEGIHS